ncbi:hypothetical protein ABW20_dc0105501 [Dactylellina cionopaga]|nr:hypothetical protein ABW20_dc0105501 [Dactylellina cionopaga]
MASGSYSGRGRQGSPIRFLQGRAANYNSQFLTRDQWRLARDGIQSKYHVTCKEGKHFSFNLIPDSLSRHESPSLDQPPKAKVLIGPEGSKYEYPSCTCATFIDTQRACRHIFWVLDNVLIYDAEEPDNEGSLSLRKDGHCLRSHTGPYYQLKSTGLADIAHSNGWIFSGVGEWGVPAQTKDMLRHFDQSTSYQSSHYSDDYLTHATSLPGAVYRLAISKPQFFADLRQEAPVDPCTKSYFRTLSQKIDYTFQRWINYTKTGKPRLDHKNYDTHPDDDRAPNVVWISSKLREYVYDIEIALYQRQPLSFENECRAFGLLLKMFQAVSDMDVDAPQVHYRPRHIQVFDETLREQNLYTNLIRTYSPDYKNFAISAMRRIPSAGRDHLQTLMEYWPTIQATASREYIAEFEALCRDIEDS